MALRQPRTPPCLSSQTSRPIPKKHFHSVMMLAESNDSQMNRRSTSLQIRSSIFKTQVFENSSEGIVCYRNESGEMICEGYDEGPRFQITTPSSTFHSRNVEIIDLLQKNWVQLGDGSRPLFESKEGEAVLLQQDDH